MTLNLQPQSELNMGKRKQKLDQLEKFYLINLVEDKVDGSDFDKEIFQFLDKMREKHAIDPEDDDKPTDLQE
jgi:hypothetical protein